MDKPKRTNTKKSIVDQISQFVPQWKQVSLDDIKLQRMAGITNETYKVSHPKLAPLIYRQFGDANDNLFLNRQTESFVYKFISEEGLGPKICGMSQDIRIQTFLQSRVLKTKQMLQRQYVQNVAYALAKFHSKKPPSSQIPRQTLFCKTFFSGHSPILKKCLKKMSKQIFNEEQKQKLSQLKNWTTQEQIQYVKNASKHLGDVPLVFSHNDLLAGNVLIRKQDQKIVFIDYEYSCYNYIVYDIANYFNQAIYNYQTDKPPYYIVLKLTEEQQQNKDHFIRCYILAKRYKYQQYKQYVSKIKNKQQFKFDQKQTKLYNFIKDNMIVGELLSHLMWGWWAIIVSKNPDIKFDYISFSMQRFRLYKQCKQIIQERKKTHKTHSENEKLSQKQQQNHKTVSSCQKND